MLLTKLVAILGLSQTSLALFMWFPAYKCAEDDSCGSTSSKRSEKRSLVHGGFIAIDLVQSTPQNDIPPNVRARRLANRLARKYGSPTATIGDEDVVKRDEKNKYSILSAAVPTQSNSAGIDQDGTDFSYFTTVTLGTSKIPYHMLLDTGAGQSWVMGDSCTSTPCTNHNTFGPSDSTTYKPASGSFTVGYGTGDVAGTQATDDVQVAGMKFSMTFGVANETSIDFNNFPIDGIFGLNRAISDNNYPNLMQALADAKLLKSNIFGVSLSRAKDGPNTGAINFGEIDTSRFSGDIAYTSVGDNSKSYWVIPIDGYGVGNKKSSLASIMAYIDTGTSFIFGPKDYVKAFHDLIPGASSADGVTYEVPCSTTDSAFFTISGVTYEISYKDWVGPVYLGSCTSNIYGMPVIAGTWLLGDTFLKNVYTVFDFDQDRIGFAPTKQGSAVTSSATTSSPTGGPNSLSTAISSSIPGSTNSVLSTQSNGGPTGSSSNSPSSTVESVASATGTPGLNGHQSGSSSGTAVAESSSGSTPSPTHKSSAIRVSAALYTTILASIALIFFAL